ncbi:hypothetical protein [Salmonella enterica]|uniref:Uncharacterized protein n=1 Tax=Salmonella enterica TaxID=28901 RepID=A0A701YWG9_SALER|nr:hypothetical protein [Salmonella enterica]HAC6565562.1 hypothetical protein [Salmonella enterica subsp. indica]HBC0160391.1 hypothetical protein [Salmonella enterica subsp. indica]HCM1936148.1 hypothetical protein [Salmonella enterica subsp. indica serovar 6,7:z41:1,7]
MKRYNEMLQYFNNDNSSSMDIERYLNIAGEDLEWRLERVYSADDSDTLLKANYLFRDASSSDLYLYSWKLFFKVENNSIDENTLLCNFVSMRAMELFCDYIDNRDTVGFYKEQFYKQGIPLLMLIMTGQIDLARRCYPFFIDGLKIFDAKRARKLLPQKTIVLAIEMLASEHKQTVDWQSHGVPVERFYYDFVKEALYSQDEAVLKEWLTALCDNHLKWSARTEVTEDEYALNGYEIEPQELLLWPFEYQAVKNFRVAHGLTTPEIDHPLLKTPLATEHRADFSKWDVPEWFYPLVDRLISVNSRLAFTRELFK